jgi:hypothetical protein
MRQFYIKKLGFQELGSPKKDGKLSRGRYILISKKYLDFFPHLSKTVNNDAVVIPIIPFFDNKKVYSWYVYHNDKYNRPNGTRDEYRIYLNKGLDFDNENNTRIYNLDDIVVFERINQEENSNMPIYFMYRFEPNSDYYLELEELIIQSASKGKHAILEGDLSFINSSLQILQQANIEISDDAMAELEKQQEEILLTEDEDVDTLEENLEQIRGAHLFNSVSFRDFVMLAYNYKCAITQQSIIWKNLNNLEAAHIQPKAQSGTFLPCNGIALCRDMHWAFDKGFITINKDFCVEVHPEVKNTLLQQYNGKKITVPIDPFFQPASKFLEHHKLKIYGLFKYSGVIRA